MHLSHSLPVPSSSSKELKQTQHKSVNMLLSIATFDHLCRVRLLVILLPPSTKFKCPSFVEVSVVTSRERFLPVTALCCKLFLAFSSSACFRFFSFSSVRRILSSAFLLCCISFFFLSLSCFLFSFLLLSFTLLFLFLHFIK